jgi:hypothetical protein
LEMAGRSGGDLKFLGLAPHLSAILGSIPSPRGV